jgi:hypothetical protein
LSEITLEKTYALLEKLADYVMTEIPALKADVSELKADVLQLKINFVRLDGDVTNLRGSVARLEKDMTFVKNMLEKQSGVLDIIRTEQIAISKTLTLHEKRIGNLEEKVFGHRIRKNDAEYGKDV